MKKQTLRKLLPLIILTGCITLCGCASKNTRSDIKVEPLKSELFSETEYNQMLDEIIAAYNDTSERDVIDETQIEEIIYVGDDCLKQEIQDWLSKKDVDNDIKDYMLLKLKVDTYQLKDKFVVGNRYPEYYYYFFGKNPNGKWDILRSGLPGYGAYDLRCELNKK